MRAVFVFTCTVYNVARVRELLEMSGKNVRGREK